MSGGGVVEGLPGGGRMGGRGQGGGLGVRRGVALTVPAVIGVATYAVRVDGDDIYVEA
mgnify:CR=1 FL=1